MSEIDSLPGRHVFFLDDNLFGNPRFASSLFSGMQGMGRIWQAAATVDAVLRPNLLEQAVASGLRSLFVGFESLTPGNLASQGKRQNLGRDYAQAVRRLHDLGVMVNGSFVFGMDEDDTTVFDRTVEWAITQGIETATFHVLTPYPGTALYQRMAAAGRMTTSNWTLYDTRHTVFQPALMTSEQLEAGYWGAYRHFYSWRSILRSSCVQDGPIEQLRHLAYVGAWKKCEPLWDVVIRAKRLTNFMPVLESVLASFERNPSTSTDPVTRRYCAFSAQLTR